MRTPALHRYCIYQLHCTSFFRICYQQKRIFDLKQMFVIIIAHILQKEKRKYPIIPITGFYKIDLA